VGEALVAVDLQGYGDRPTNTLSGGEKQRVAIAGALVVNPKVTPPPLTPYPNPLPSPMSQHALLLAARAS